MRAVLDLYSVKESDQSSDIKLCERLQAIELKVGTRYIFVES
jgi:hypothetical protein